VVFAKVLVSFFPEFLLESEVWNRIQFKLYRSQNTLPLECYREVPPFSAYLWSLPKDYHEQAPCLAPHALKHALFSLERLSFFSLYLLTFRQYYYIASQRASMFSKGTPRNSLYLLCLSPLIKAHPSPLFNRSIHCLQDLLTPESINKVGSEHLVLSYSFYKVIN